MPDILTHLIGADETIKQLNEDIAEILIQNKKVFNLGAQGPDLFFYYKPLPWSDSGNMGDYGSEIHQEHINDFFINAADRIKHSIATDPIGFFKSSNKKTALHVEFAYLAGFLSHYAFDTICHPYIFYFSGIDSGYNHKYFECAIDTLITEIFDGKKVKLHKTGQAITLSKNENRIISLYLAKTLRDTFDFKIPEDSISRCIRDMTSTLKALYDPIKLKRSPFSLIDKVSKSRGRIMTATFPAKLDKSVDYLNIKKTKWLHPCDDQLVYNSSFLELFNDSVDYSHELIRSLSHYLVNSSIREEFETLIGNKQYDTGLSDHLQMKHERIIVNFKTIYRIKK